MVSGVDSLAPVLSPLQSSVVLTALLLPLPIHASPLDNGRVGGLNMASPVEPHPASALQNPAALSLLKGTHFFLDATARLEHQRLRRTAIDGSTGLPGGAANITFDRRELLHWTPDLYFGATSDFGSDLLVLGLSLATPHNEIQRMSSQILGRDPSLQNELRYHRIRSDWAHLFVTTTVAIKIHDRFRVGVGLSYVRTILRYTFSRDRKIRGRLDNATDPIFEDPQFTERIDLDASSDSLGFSVGVLAVILKKKLFFGASYRSEVVDVGRGAIRAQGKARVRFFDTDPVTGGFFRTVQGRGRMTYRLPDSVLAAVRYQPNPWWNITFGFAYIHWARHKRLKFTLTGSQFRSAGFANFDLRFRHRRGFQDSFRGSVQADYTPLRSRVLKVGFGVTYESPAVKPRWVNPAAIDNHKVDLLLSLVWRLHKNFAITIGYSIVLAPEVNVARSGFDPGLVVRCIEGRVDILWDQNCQETEAGKGLNTAAGSYWQFVHRFGLGFAYDRW